MNTDYQAQSSADRFQVVQALAQLMASGLSLPTAAERLGIPRSTMRSWYKACQSSGFPGLVPATANCGRLSAADKLAAALGPEQFQATLDQVKGLAYDLESPGLAWRHYSRQAEAPQPVREYFAQTRRSKHNIARSLLDLVKVSPIEAKAHRGPRKLNLEGMYTPRRLDILPGDVASSDDTTPIWAWWIPWFKCREYPYGVKLLQGQFLPYIDVASQKILCYALIAREASSYRAADIWALFGHAFDTFGLPRLGLQLERSSWDSNLIQGVEPGLPSVGGGIPIT